MSKLKKFLSLPYNDKKIKIKRYVRRKLDLWTPKSYIPSGYKKKSKIIYSGPKISILLPIYNHADVAIKAINSVLNQTYKNIELIILDDGSKDGLLDKIKDFSNLDNVKIYTQKNQKLPRALTHLHELATGDFITWTSADNVMHPKMIEILAEKLIENPESALVYGDVTVIDANDKPYYGPCRDTERDAKKPKIIRLLRNEKPLSLGIDNYINASFLYRSENSNVLMGIYSDDIIGAEDYDYWLRLSKTGRLTHVKNKKTYYYYRVHDNSMSHELETKKASEHQSRLENLRKYEQERIAWCNKRTDIKISSSVDKEELNRLKYALSFLPVNFIESKENKNSKELLFDNKDSNEDVYVKILDNHYILVNNILNKDVVKIFKGIDIPREAFKARNLYSRSYYQDDLIRIKKPIFGCHINSKTVDLQDIKENLANNSSIHFVILDETSNEIIRNLSLEYLNLTYYENKEFGIEYQSYSYFARVISFKDSSEQNKYKNLLLAYAIGRKISYTKDDDFFSKYPYTIPTANSRNINFSIDAISDKDYEIMDKYIESYSTVNCLSKIIKFYSAHTQEMYIKRPKYQIENIPEESKPVLAYMDKEK